MPIRVIIIFLLLILLAEGSRAQLAFEKTYHTSGSVRDLLHMKTRSDNSVATAGIVVNSTAELNIEIKAIDMWGNPMWSIYAFNGNDLRISNIDINSNDEILVAGYGKDDADNYEGFMIKISSSGNVLWKKLFTPAGKYSGIYGAWFTKEGNIMAYGFSIPLGGGEADHFYLKTDISGNTLTAKSLYSSGIWGHCAPASDGIYVFAHDAVIKVNENGSIQWTLKNQDMFYLHTQLMAVGKDNSLYLIYTFKNNNNALMKVSPSGTVNWIRDLHIGGITRIFSLNDSLLILNANNVYHYDNNGKHIKTIEYASRYSFMGIGRTCGGQYFIAGVDNSNTLLIKTMPDLSSSCSAPVFTDQSDLLSINCIPETRTSTTVTFVSSDLPGEFDSISLSNQTHCLFHIPFRIDLGQDTMVCNNGTFRLDAGVSATRYLWSTGETTQTITIKKEGWVWVRAESECYGTATDSIFIRFYPLPNVNFLLEPSTIEPGEPITLTDLTPGIKERWWNLDTVFSRDSVAQTTADRNGIFTVELFVKDQFNCVSSWPRQFKAELFRFYVPTAFSPNGDNLNDVFEPVGFGVKNYRMLIFDRWGRIIADCNNDPWDGRSNGRITDTGVYFYKLECTGYFDKKASQSGTVTLIK